MVMKIAIHAKNEIERSKTWKGTSEAMAHFHRKDSMVQRPNLQVKSRRNLLVENLKGKIDESNIVEKNVYKDVIEFLDSVGLV